MKCDKNLKPAPKAQCAIQNVVTRTYTKGQKVKVLVGCVWQNAKVEDYHPDPKYYLCGTSSWSTHFHECMIKHA